MRTVCGKDGKVLLYGTGCVRCDCGGAILEIDGVTSKAQAERLSRRAFAFDLGDDLGDAFAYMTAAITDPPYHFNCRSTIDPVFGDGSKPTEDEADLMAGWYRGQEIITNPADPRGHQARRVGAR